MNCRYSVDRDKEDLLIYFLICCFYINQMLGPTGLKKKKSRKWFEHSFAD